MTTIQATNRDHIVLESVPTNDRPPSITDEHGAVAAPRPGWANYAEWLNNDVTFYGEPTEVMHNETELGKTEVRPQADLTAFISPSWVEWQLLDPVIRVRQDREEYSLAAAEELAHAILAAVAVAKDLETDRAIPDPMDEGNKRARVDGSGAIWEWTPYMEKWRHVSDEFEPVATLAEINEAAGPLRIDGGAR